MTPGDVMDAIMSDDRITHWRGMLESLSSEPDQCGDAIQMFSKMVDCLRPGPDAKTWTPISPREITRLRVALRTIADAIDVAQSRKPSHFYVVKKGGR